MKAIRFLVDCDGSGPNGRPFNQGSAHLLKDDSAWHWVRRDKAEYIEHVATPELPPDPVVEAAGVADPVRTKAEATIAKVDEILANPPSVLAPLIEQAEKANGDTVGGATEDVGKPDSAGAGVWTKPSPVPAVAPAGSGRSTVRGGRN